ncbi:unnamed protein product [Psylliodes chrysocephalus]|uniref:MD-2-related lipid-recognition domain-containing protein n=1 Tax=Psylliodes chrysocephalus TaxID=3402493 RepID=A0A9P0G979_9CUCU|nr:unnamed protein product [Psylliodes chrysocephala]
MRVVGLILLLLFFENASPSVLDYLDCGYTMGIEEVTFGYCTYSPCTVNINKPQEIFVKLSSPESVPPFQTIRTTANLLQMNIPWELKITPENPCTSWNCPLSKPITDQSLSATVDFSNIALLRPGRLLIRGYVSEPVALRDPLFCVEIAVSLTRQ